MRPVYTILATLLLLSAGYSRTMAQQADAANLKKARLALDNKNCEDAAKALSLVTPQSQQTTDYYQYMGRMQDCRQNREQALYYYRKYAALNPGNDTVNLRMAELLDQKNKPAPGSAMAVDKRSTTTTSPPAYHTATTNTVKGRNRRKGLREAYFASGIGYSRILGGVRSPFKAAADVSGFSGFPVMRNKALIEISSAFGLLVSGNSDWYTATLHLPVAPPVSTGSYLRFLAGFSALPINERRLALSVGPVAGINLYMFPPYDNIALPDVFGVAYGVKSNLYLGESVMFYLQVLLNSNNTVKAETYSGLASYPANFNMIGIGACLRFDTWW